MRIPPLAVGLAVVVTLLLSGCLPLEPTVSPTPRPSSTPVFASEEEALAAAEAAYARYLEVSDAIAADGGANPERLQQLATPEWFLQEQVAFEEFASSGNHQTGSTSFRNSELQQLIDEGGGAASVVMYVCLDASATRIVDGGGVDVTPANRPTSVSLEVTFDVPSADPSHLRLANNEPWPGESFC